MTESTKDRYRPIFCEGPFYQDNLFLFSEWNRLFQGLSSIQKVQAWVVGLSLLRRPDDWFGGVRKVSIAKNDFAPLAHPTRLLELAGPESRIRIPTKVNPGLSVLEIVNTVHIKAIPDSCVRSLVQMTNLTYPLEVIEHVPTPVELLTYQLQGRRVISFNEDYLSWPTALYHGRDFLSFMIHDLIHADHFFLSAKNRCGQLGFYRCLEMIFEDVYLYKLLLDKEFKSAFEYIISDMNSHPLHLFKTLQARLGLAVADPDEVNRLWIAWTRVWSREDLTVLSALQKINTQLFSHKDAITITLWCEAKGTN